MNATTDTTIYIVRHGETDWNVKGFVQGHSDIPLNATGQQQAKEFGKLLEHIHIDAVFSSDLLRAKKTAELAVLEKKLAVQTTEVLRERFFGSMEGKHRKEFAKLYPLQKNLTKEQKLIHRLVPDMENDEEVIGRVITFLREVAVGYTGKTVLIVSHGALIRVLLEHLGFFDEEHPMKKIENTAYLKMRSDGVDFFIEETKGIEKE
jgi:broad specificity phosphatase PhoE